MQGVNPSADSGQTLRQAQGKEKPSRVPVQDARGRRYESDADAMR